MNKAGKDNNVEEESPEVEVVDELSEELLEAEDGGELDEVSALRAECQAKAVEAEEHRNAALRARADLDNVRRRLEKEKTEHINYGNERLIKELLGIMDNFERALEHAGEDNAEDGVNALKGGVELIYGQMKAVLENFGLKEVLAVGEKFDPKVHEAISRDESEEHESDIVIKEFQKGYFLKDRLLRPSMVSVAE